MKKSEEVKTPWWLKILFYAFWFWLFFLVEEKYKGHTAKEWSSLYYDAVDNNSQLIEELNNIKFCIEDYPYSAKKKCL